LIRGDVQTQMANTSLMYTDALALAQDRLIQERCSNFVTFNGTPAHQQAYLLSNDPTLTDADRSAILTGLIQPLLQPAEAQQLDPSATSAFIERSLTTFQPQDPEQRRLFNLIMPNRVHTTLALDNFYAVNSGLPGGHWGRNQTLNNMVSGHWANQPGMS